VVTVRTVVRCMAAGLMTALLAGCPTEDATTGRTGDGTLSHAEVLGVMRAIHAGEIDQGTYAQRHLERGMVDAFAGTIVQDHRRSLDELRAIAERRTVTPAESGVSIGVRQHALDELQELEGQEGRELAEAFVAAQIELHQEALDVIDRELLRAAADDPELLQYVSGVRTLVAGHLQLARDVQRQDEHRALAEPPSSEQ
jgi:putative membrane protein